MKRAKIFVCLLMFFIFSVEAFASEKTKKIDFSAPPNLELQLMKLWVPNFATKKICIPTTGECREMPTEKFYCVDGKSFDANSFAKRTIIDAGKKCKRWGENWLKRTLNTPRSKCDFKAPAPKLEVCMNAEMAIEKERTDKIQSEIPKRNPQLDEAVTYVVEFSAKKLIHISWLTSDNPNYSVSPTSDMICMYEKERNKQLDFIEEIFQRCYEWGE